MLLVDNGSLHLKNIELYLQNKKIEYVKVDENANKDSLSLNHCKGVILSGGPLNLSKKININQISLSSFILLNPTIPILGICLGHQIISALFGAQIKSKEKRVMGFGKIKILDKSDLFNGLDSELIVKKSHINFISTPPINFSALAISDDGVIEAIKHYTKPVYGVQFHPESSKEVGAKVLDNFIEICSKYELKK